MLMPAHVNLGAILRQMGRLDEAVACCRQALQLNENWALVHLNLGAALNDLGRLDEAVISYRRALELQPEIPQAHANLAVALADLGLLDEAIAACREAIRLQPDLPAIHSGLLFIAQFHPKWSAADLLREAREWNRRHGEPLARVAAAANPPEDRPAQLANEGDRRLRIGYVSPYFRGHCQSLFTLPLFRCHDRQRFEIFCYADVAQPDAVTDRLRAVPDIWRNVAGLSDAQLAGQIRADRIDVLVDLTMHMAFNRLTLFAMKPAPVQLCWLAYPGTTGLSAMDYRLTDPHLDPPGLGDCYSERSLVLPETFWCYEPFENTPAVTPVPALAAGHLTFGCLNNCCKINDSVLALWGRVLRELPASRLLLLVPEGEARRRVMARLKDEQVAPRRVEFVDRQPMMAYLATYHRIDIALDTFPYNGHTTSLDAMWMGVPVVTLIGDRVVGRAGLSQLHNLGLAEQLAARDANEFVTLAVGLANDLPRLATLRQSLRARMAASPLTDGPRFARGVEAAYRQAWQGHCIA